MTIDDLNLRNAQRESLRSRLTVLPQDPVQFPGTVRDNLQLSREYNDTEERSFSSDTDMRAALLKVGLWDKLGGDGLDADLASLNFSHGQKQLFAIARMLLHKAQVVLLDEATSNLGEKTDAAVQKVMRDAFNGCTVLSVAHRLDSISDFDIVAVMDAGRIVEIGDPKVLATQQDSRFKRLKDEWRGDKVLEMTTMPNDGIDECDYPEVVVTIHVTNCI